MKLNLLLCYGASLIFWSITFLKTFYTYSWYDKFSNDIWLRLRWTNSSPLKLNDESRIPLVINFYQKTQQILSISFRSIWSLFVTKLVRQNSPQLYLNSFMAKNGKVVRVLTGLLFFAPIHERRNNCPQSPPLTFTNKKMNCYITVK